jgi:hypothetical protein
MFLGGVILLFFSKALSARYHTEIWHFDEAFVMDALSVIEAFFT